jgi:hypothetical protein
MATFFQLELRVVPCDVCGAPLEGLRAGGNVSCRFCHCTQQLTAREDSAIQVGQRMPEAQRMELLRRQDMFAQPTPPALKDLVFGDRLVPWQVSQSLARWQLARRQHDAEELFVLTRVLSTHYERSRSLLEERALLEGALDEITDPRKRQVLRALLARAAALSGDVNAGAAWLASCDPTPADLESDGTHRYARACIETVRGNFNGVLEALGQSEAFVPLPNDLDPLAQVIRANAWEKLGQTDRARDMLVHLAEHGGPLFHLRARELIELYPELRLCERSAVAAESRIQSVYRARARERSFRSLNTIIFIGFVILLLCGAAIGFSILGDVFELGFGLHPVTLLVVVFVAMTGFLLVVLGLMDKRRMRREQNLREEGRLVPGVVVHRVATGNVTMGVPEMMVRVLVLDGATGYLASTEAFFRDPDSPSFARGSLVALRIDRDDPHEFALVL